MVPNAAGPAGDRCADCSGRDVVDGLRLTITGGELRRLLDDRIAEHERSAAYWKRELIRAAGEQADEGAGQNEETFANEAVRHEWRIDVLAFIRDHVEPLHTYCIDRSDLIFAELLPMKPWFVEKEAEDRAEQ